MSSDALAVLGTRATTRLIAAGSVDLCAYCDQHIKFRGKIKGLKVLANVYEGLRWDRLECFHAACYKLAGEPYGPADRSKLPKLLRGVL